jgi:tetratricopeptide (TPR) repeat protein
MLGSKRLETLGFFLVMAAGVLVYHLGSRLGSDRPSEVQSKAATPARAVKEDSQHEALILGEALKKRPYHTPVLLRLAQLAQESGNYREAARDLQEILRHEPDNTDARLELGRVLFQSGDVQEAIAQTRRILDRQPNHADALYNLGAIYANLGNATLARAYWNRLLIASPQSESARRAKSLMVQLPVSPSASVENAVNPHGDASSREEKAAKVAVKNYTASTFGGKK